MSKKNHPIGPWRKAPPDWHGVSKWFQGIETTLAVAYTDSSDEPHMVALLDFGVQGGAIKIAVDDERLTYLIDDLQDTLNRLRHRKGQMN